MVFHMKTTLNIDDRVNARGNESEKLYCIYVCVGQKRSTVAQIVKTLEESGALKIVEDEE